MAGQGTEPRWIPKTLAEKSAVIDQLDRLLVDPRFAKSQRYPSFLRFVVSRALDGDEDSLKERILGIEVFGRKPDYDTAEDAIVRVTAAKIRKRISEYYENPEHQGELKLNFPAGSYVPIFEQPHTISSEQAAFAETHLPRDKDSPSIASSYLFRDVASEKIAYKNERRSFFRRWAVVGVIGLCAIAVVEEGLAWERSRNDAFSGFWGQVISARRAALFCMADEPRGTVTLMDASNPVLPEIAGSAPSIIDVDNVGPVTELGRMLSNHGRTFTVQGQRRTTLSDLGAGPDILLGAFNNVWTLRFTKDLRYHFANDAERGMFWIQDRENPANTAWMRHRQVQAVETGKDYALIARFKSSDSGQPTVVIAGLSHQSNVAAVNFVLTEDSLHQMDQAMPKGWHARNMEVVLEMSVVDGHAGQPRIVGSSTW